MYPISPRSPHFSKFLLLPYAINFPVFSASISTAAWHREMGNSISFFYFFLKSNWFTVNNNIQHSSLNRMLK